MITKLTIFADGITCVKTYGCFFFFRGKGLRISAIEKAT